YVSEGSGEFLIENQNFYIKKDDLIIVNPHIQHTEISLSASPLSYYTVGVDGISFSFHDQKEFQIFHCSQKHADLLFYFHSLFQELDEKNDGYEEICKHTLAILISQSAVLSLIFSRFHPSSKQRMRPRQAISGFHYSDDINLNSLPA
ncbi:MAG: AraC family ligand binding domain-containing protein, partial [Blautia obeum]